MLSKISVIMGSQSDWHIMKNACEVIDSFKVPYEKEIVSAHRTTEDMVKYGKQSQHRGIKVIIAGAGGAAHLPGMVASITRLPVVGVPIKLEEMGGLDSLLSIVQMPKGVPVATVGINNSTNAALLALRILAIGDKNIAEQMDQYRSDLYSKVKKQHLKM